MNADDLTHSLKFWAWFIPTFIGLLIWIRLGGVMDALERIADYLEKEDEDE